MISKILGGVTIAMGIGMFFMFQANASLNEAIGEARITIDLAEATNSENLDTIAALQENLTLCVTQRTVNEQANAIVVSQLQSDLAIAEERTARVEIIREEIFRDPSCAELGALDIGATCPALVSSLLERADDLN